MGVIVYIIYYNRHRNFILIIFGHIFDVLSNVVYFSAVVLKVLALTFGFLSLARPAHAYLDPGTGSYFVQILLAGIAGGGYIIVSSWGKIRQFLSSIFKKEKKENQGDEKSR